MDLSPSNCGRSLPPRSRPPRLVLGLALGLGLGLTFGACHRGGPPEIPPEPGPAASADAAGLPRFDVAEGPGDRRPQGSAVPHERFFVEVGDAPVRGPADAPVTIVAFYDFECGYCERGHRTIQRLEQEYPGRLRIAHKAFPLAFHRQALLAALASRAAQAQGKFWEFHDHIFDQDRLDLQQIPDYAAAVGLDLTRLAGDIDSVRHGPAVRRDLRQGIRLGVRGTPAYFINGRMLSGARPIGELREIIDEELALAETWRAQGIAADGVYAHAIADGYRRVTYAEAQDLVLDQLYPVPLGDSPVRGDPQAPVTIVAFTDFECPYCTRGHETLEKVRARYGRKIRVVFKHLPLPFHSHAFRASRAALAAREAGKFWEFHDGIFGLDRLDDDALLSLAKRLGLDRRRIADALDSPAYDGVITGDMDLARKIGVRGTPAYFVNGRPLSGAPGELELRIVVQEELERAEAKLAAGVAPGKLYEVVSSEE